MGSAAAGLSAADHLLGLRLFACRLRMRLGLIEKKIAVDSQQRQSDRRGSVIRLSSARPARRVGGSTASRLGQLCHLPGRPAAQAECCCCLLRKNHHDDDDDDPDDDEPSQPASEVTRIR